MADWRVTFGILDGEGHNADITIWLDGATTIANIDDWVPLMQALIQDIVTGDVRTVHLSRLFDVFTAGTAAPDSDVEIRGKFTFQPLGTIKRLLMRIPTFNRNYVDGGAKTIDLANSDIVAFTDAMVDGLTVNSTLIRPRDTENRTLDGVISATEDYGKTRK